MIAAGLAMTVSIAAAVAPVVLIARAGGRERTFLITLGRRVTDRDRAWERGVQVVAVTALLAAAVAIPLVPPRLAAAILQLAIFIPILALLAGTLRAVRTSYAPAPAGRFTVPLDAPFSAASLASPAVEVANFAVMVCGFSGFYCLLPHLPPEIPLRFGPDGQPTLWGPPSELWTSGGHIVLQTVMLWGLLLALAYERVALVPEAQKPTLSLQRARRLLLARWVESTMVIGNTKLAVLWLAVAVHGLPDSPLPSGAIAGLAMFFSVLSFAPMVYFVPRLVRVQDALRRLSGSDAYGTHASGWRFGGLIYFAPDDPAIFVPKKLGIGQTLNFARPAAWIVLGATMIAPAVLIWLIRKVIQ